ncbi:helix-turn-helix domain-containing protein [Kushneria aurantia]|uniref:Helix-turn-helix domain-containing protein n=1 Tax=Kushneria aurantia TaxID=504092 RepID=A0ABV6G6N2_9GAMM|nr:XRE family transcriptional regulator [Kushneria aurantia]
MNVVEEKSLGSRIRKARKLKKMSLSELSKIVDVSVGQLSQIERDISSPSIKVMRSICQCLEQPMLLMLDDTDTEANGDATIIKKSKRGRLEFPGRGMHKEIMTPAFCHDLQIIETVLEPGGVSGDDDYQFSGTEVIVVLAGWLEVIMGEAIYLLDEGDTICIPHAKPHRFRNPCNDKKSWLLCATSPVFYPG